MTPITRTVCLGVNDTSPFLPKAVFIPYAHQLINLNQIKSKNAFSSYRRRIRPMICLTQFAQAGQSFVGNVGNCGRETHWAVDGGVFPVPVVG